MAKYTEPQEFEYLAVSCGDKMQRIPSSIVMENARQARNQGWRQEEGCRETRTSSRDIVQLTVYEERGEELIVNDWPVVSDQHYGSAALRVSWAYMIETLDEG